MNEGGLKNDAVVWLSAAVFLAYLALYALPILTPGQLTAFSATYAEPVLVALVLVAILHGIRDIKHVEERRFWGFLGLCFGCWLAGLLLFSFLSPGPGAHDWVHMAGDSMYLLSYLACVLAAEQRPHLKSGWSHRSPTYAFSSLGTLLFVLGLIVYFLIIPYFFDGGRSAGKLSTYPLIIALDVLLAIRFFHLCWTCRVPGWRLVYGALGICAALWTATDTLECLINRGVWGIPYGTPLDALWYIPFAVVIAISRSRTRSRVSVSRRGEVGPEGWRAGAPVLLLIFAFLFPIFHMALALSGLVGRTGHEPREYLVLSCLLAFVILAVSEHRLLEKRHREFRSTIQDLVTQEQILQSQKMEAIGRLAGGVAHDFNNILMVINGHTSLLSERLRTDPEVSRSVKGISEAAERAGWLTRQLLAFSRRQTLHPETLDLNDVVGDSKAMVRRLLPENIFIETYLSGEPCLVRADAGQLLQVILNLAINARDAMPGGGTLTFRTANVDLSASSDRAPSSPSLGPYAVLMVGDTGCGMDEATRAQVFEPFFTSKPGGTGLGLAIVHRIVRQNGGFIRVHSRKNGGTTFIIHQPRIPGRAEEALSEPERVDESRYIGRTVLVAEDEAPVRGVIRKMLEHCGFEVLEAADGEEALRVCESRAASVDLLITDIVMPGVSGWELARRFRELHPKARVLYMSGHQVRRDEAEPEPGDFEAFMPKPFSLPMLQRELSGLMGDGGRTRVREPLA